MKKEKKAEGKYRIIKAKSFNGNDIYIPEKREHMFFIPYWEGLITDQDGLECGFPTLEQAEKVIEKDAYEGEYEVIKYM